jgi:hypothetical protein
MAQPQVARNNGAKTTKVTRPTKPASVEEAHVRGLSLDNSTDDNLIQQYSIDEFIELGAAVPNKFRVKGKPVISANSNGTLYFGFILNAQWFNAYLSNALQGKDSKGNPDPKLDAFKVSKGEQISKSRHAIQLRFNPDATPDKDEDGNDIVDNDGNPVINPCYYLLVRNGGGSAVLTSDDFAE